MIVAVSKAQQKAIHKYMAANYDRINLTVAKGQRDAVKAHAETKGESTSAFIGRAILEAIKRDTAGDAPAAAGGRRSRRGDHTAVHSAGDRDAGETG